MNAKAPKTAIIVVSWNHGRFLSDCFRAVSESGIAPGEAVLMIADNDSSDGTADLIEQELLNADGTATKEGFPCVFFRNDVNLGFSGGNNQAIRKALDDGFDYVYLLNPDTEAQAGFLSEVLRVAESDQRIGIVQSLLQLHPRTDLVNTYGNEIHFLGFGYAGGESTAVNDSSIVEKLRVRDIAYASGAGMLVRASMLKEIGFLDEELFAYHEDLEFSWRSRLAGWRVVLAPQSVVFHKYEFSRAIEKYYLMERNRFIVMARMYRVPTMILLFPAFIIMEIGLWAFAVKGGWWRQKLRAYAHFATKDGWSKLIEARRRTQALRMISDREATTLFTGKILFQQMRPALLTLVANPAFAIYWRISRFIMFW